MLANGTDSGRSEGKGLWLELSEGTAEGRGQSSYIREKEHPT